MKVIGYNSSHETSLCQFDTDTWDIDFYTKKKGSDELSIGFLNHLKINWYVLKEQVEKPDAFIGASFDRRNSPLIWDTENLQYDKTMQEIIDFIQEEQMTHDRLEMIEKFEVYPIRRLQTSYQRLRRKVIYSQNKMIHGRNVDQLEMEEFHYEIEHHLYHAECGYWFSPWKEKETNCNNHGRWWCHKYADKVIKLPRSRNNLSMST